jgi:hypothetical protein
MSLRHAAALALVGWYLMTPPLGPINCSTVEPRPANEWAGPAIKRCQAKIESQAPFRQWTRVPDTQEFEYKTDCERAISNDCHSEAETDGRSFLEGDLCSAECIASDDPRLKEK